MAPRAADRFEWLSRAASGLTRPTEMSTTMQTAAPVTAPNARHLNGRVADFLMLGGGSLLALLGLRWAFGDATWAGAWSAGTTLALANVINNPHFAHSYQLF